MDCGDTNLNLQKSKIILDDEYDNDDHDEIESNAMASVNCEKANCTNQLAATPVAGNSSSVGSNATATGEDSDYYTPEDPMTTILSPLHSDKERPIDSGVSVGNNIRWVGPREGVSLPGTPSTASHRSSGDSYSSSGSTRLLLTANDKTTHA